YSNGDPYDHGTDHAPAPSRGASRAVDYASTFDDGYAPADEDVHVEVTFEEEAAQPATPTAAAQPERAPAKATDAPKAELGPDEVDPALYETSLGLLDAFDEYGDYRPKDAAAPTPPA